MAKTKLVCNLGMADFFTLPDSGEVWRRRFGENAKTTREIEGRKVTGYECESLYDNTLKCWLPADERVEIADV